MKGFSSGLAAICSACLLIGTLHMLCPDGVMEKPVKYLVSLAFLLTVTVTVLPAVKNADFHFAVSPPSAESDTALETAAAEYVYASALRAEGINFSKIIVCTDKSEDGGISISKVIVVSDEESMRILTALRAVAENVEVVVQHE